MKEKSVRVGLVGFGTVGCGVARLLVASGDVLRAKTGVRLELACAVDLDTETPRAAQLPDRALTSDPDVLRTDSRLLRGHATPRSWNGSRTFDTFSNVQFSSVSTTKIATSRQHFTLLTCQH